MARKHPRGGGARIPAEPTPGIDPNVALFASYVRDGEQRERDAKKAAREERVRAEAAGKLVAAKDAAAAEVKRLRGREGVTAEQRAAADAAYRDALAAVVADETGTTPAWAPPAPEPEVEPAADAPEPPADVDETGDADGGPEADPAASEELPAAQPAEPTSSDDPGAPA